MRPIRIAAAAVLAAGTGVASANVIYLDQQVELNGTGLGAVATVLTVQGTGNVDTESGAVFAVGSGFDTSGDAKTGESQSQLRTLGEVNISSASDLRLVFNAVEPGNDQSITIDALKLTFYDASGGELYSASLASSVDLTGTFNGMGKSGFLFGLDDAQAAEAQAAVFGGDFSSVRVGLDASLSGSAAGPDTFFLASAGGVVPAIPEPETWALMLGGLGLVAQMARRRRPRD